MVMCSSKVAGYTRFLLDSFTDSDVDSISHEISQLVDDGVEISIPVLKTCLDCFTLRRSHPNASLLVKVLSFVFKRILTMSNPATLFSNALQDVDVSEEFVNDFTTSLDFSVSDKISFALSLTDFERSDAKSSGRNLLLAEIEQLCATTGHIEPTEQIQNVLSFLRKSEDLSSHLDSFILFLSSAQPRDGFSFPLTPILSHEVLEANVFRSMDFHSDSDENEIDVILAEIDKEIVVGDLMVELGCGFTADAQQCNQILSSFAPLNETTISRIIGNAARSNADLEDNHTTFSTFSLALGLCTPSELPAPRPWNVDILIATIKQLAPYTSWRKVIENLDHDGFYIPSMESFSFFMLLYKTACKEPFPLDAVCASVWKNTEGQLSFLKYAIAAPPEVFTFMHSSRKLVYIDNIMHSHEQQFGLPNQAWLSLDLLDVLCQLAERGHTVLVSSLLQYPLTHCPKTLLLGMTHIKTAYYLIQREVVSAVLPVIITNPQDSGLVVNLWHQNAELVLWGISNSQNLKADSILRIIDIAHELKILSIVLESVPVSFSIRLAVLASLRGFLDIENWLPNCLYLYKDHFAEECIKYVKNVHFSESEDFTSKYYHPSDPLTDLHLNATTSLLKALKANDSVITSSQLVEEIEKVNAAILNCNSKVQNGETKDLSASNAYGDDVEVEANAYFHQMFCGQLSVDAMVQMLSRYKDSLVQREKSIFECMIANLFEEYRFFHKYPERQLKIASILFGSVIKHQLISSITLGMALRLVLDSLRKPADSKMFLFGSKALEQFVNRLVELPQYCNHILQISHLRTTHPELVTVIEQALSRISSSNFEPDASLSHPGPSQSFPGNSELSCSGIGQSALQLPSHVQPEQKKELHIDDRQVPNVPSNEAKPLLPSSSNTSSDVSIIHKNPGISTSSTMGSFVRPARGVTSTRFGSALNIETLVAAAERRQNAIETPPPDVQDKISFIINNISTANIESKGKEFAEILPQQYYPWFAQYMVMKRASIEPNFHDLYLKFFEKVDSKLLFKEILQNTYENCKVLLGSELIKSSSEERSLLKNLGSWLGKLTIGRNYVLRGKEIDPKYLIVEAYEKGLMIAVIPFTSKVLEPCLNSIAYRPPNPWTMAILGLLAEIYLLPNLKMNLKFDIEVLFKNLGVDLKEVAPTSILNDRKREIDGNPDFSNKDLGVTHKSQPQMIPEPKTISPLKQIDLPLDVANLPNADAPSKLLSQYVAPQRVYTNTLTEDEKAATLGLSDQPPSPQGLFQSTPSTLFSMSQLSAALPNIGNHVVINQKLSGFGMHYPIQRVVPIAMDRAIREIVSGIVQRSVCIACQTTKELVLKDYALEPDETRIYNAAHLMVASLAGSLAHVTCKEPLRTSISTHLRNSLQGLNITNDAHPLEQIVQLVTNDNLDLGCAAIEQAVTEKAIQTIDADIDQQLLLRRKHRDGAGSSFLDPNMLAQNSVSSIPESLRPKPGHLSQSQQRVYEDFVQLPWQKQSTQSPHSLSAASSSSGDVGLGSVYGPVSGKIASDFLSSAGNARDDLVPRESDISVEGLESSAVSLLSSQVDPAGLELSKPTSTSELTLVESSGASIKETGTSLQTLTSATTMERLGGNNITHPSLSTRDALDKYQIVTQKVVYIAKIILASLYHVVDFLKFQMEDLVANNARDNEIQAVVSEVPEIILRCISRDEAALAVAQKAFKALYENASSNLHVSANLAILVVIRDVCKLVVKELTSWVIYSEEERKLNKDITIGLIQHELLNLAEYNVHMAKHLDGGRNKSATEFAVSLLQSLVNEESTVISELHSLVDALAKLSSKSGSPESLQQLIDIIRNPVANTNVLSDSATGNENNDRQSNDEKALCNTTTNTEENTNVDHVESDSAGFRNRVSTLFENWYQICEVSGANEIASSQYVLRLHQAGLLKGDETTESFFRILLELSVAHFISSEEISSGAVQSHQQAQSPSFLIIDIYAKLVFSILKCYPEQESSSKLFLLSEIIAVTVRSIQKDAENKTISPRPYFRLFINWLLDLSSLDPGSDGGNFQVLTAFANAFHALQPLKIPAFSFAWLELVSHRSFMPKLLTVNGQKGWPYVQRLLVDLLQFLEPFLRSAELGGPVNFLYKGTLRVLLVLLHDFPEFLCDYHFTFCDVIPSSCIQMRNIILSSFPRNMRLPDPSTPNLKIDLLPEIVEAPCILSEVDAALKAKQMKNDVDEYLTSRQQNSAFLSELAQKLLLSSSEASSAGTCYNVPLINSLVLYTGMQAIHQLQAGETQAQNVVALQIFKYLSMELDTEGRYLFLNAIANQLRYPNNHTHYFSFIMLYLFFESDQEIIQEQITRVLLERLIVNRPHPWGLLITFIELIKNPRYGFWKQGFIRCAPEIEKLFESVARSCGGLKPVDEGMVSGWVSDNAH